MQSPHARRELINASARRHELDLTGLPSAMDMDGRIIPFLFAKEPLGIRIWSLAAHVVCVLLLRSLVLLITFTVHRRLCSSPELTTRVSCRRNYTVPSYIFCSFFVELRSTPRCLAVPRRNMDTAARKGR
jgi:hypothetical protein